VGSELVTIGLKTKDIGGGGHKIDSMVKQRGWLLTDTMSSPLTLLFFSLISIILWFKFFKTKSVKLDKDRNNKVLVREALREYYERELKRQSEIDSARSLANGR
jgi:hypothetical protein